MNKIVIIYGSPRTGTTHLFGSFVSHPLCYGYNESPEIISLFQKGLPLDNFLERTKEKIIVLKDPRFCFDIKNLTEFINNKNVYFIFTDRNILEVIDSMLYHPTNYPYIYSDDIIFPDFSESLKNKFSNLWKITCSMPTNIKNINKMALQYLWYIQSVSKEMKEKSLCLVPYESRLNYLDVFKKLNKFVGLPENENFYKNICTFIYRHISPERKKEIKDGLLPEVLNEIRESDIDESTMDL